MQHAYLTSALENFSFRNSYQDFLDDLYIAYIFQPAGVSMLDITLGSPHVVRNVLSRENSLVCHMAEQGLIKGFVRNFTDEIETRLEAALFGKADRRRSGFFQTVFAQLDLSQIHSGVNKQQRFEAGLLLDKAFSARPSEDWLRKWPKENVGKRFKQHMFDKFINSNLALDPFFQSLDNHNTEETLDYFEAITEFGRKIVLGGFEGTSKVAQDGSLRVGECVKFACELNQIDPLSVGNSAELIAALRTRVDAKAFRVANSFFSILACQHARNFADSVEIPALATNLNPIESYILSQGPSFENKHETISIDIKLPDLQALQALDPKTLDKRLQEAGFDEYCDAYKVWHGEPTGKVGFSLVEAARKFSAQLTKHSRVTDPVPLRLSVSGRLGQYRFSRAILRCQAYATHAAAAVMTEFNKAVDWERVMRDGIKDAAGEMAKSDPSYLVPGLKAAAGIAFDVSKHFSRIDTWVPYFQISRRDLTHNAKFTRSASFNSRNII